MADTTLKSLGNLVDWLRALLPGLALCLAVTGVAFALDRLEAHLFGRDWIESLVLAILIGTLVRTVFEPGAVFDKGITFAAKPLLEVAVVLLGASISARTLAGAGPLLIGGIAGTVVVAIVFSYGISRVLGLPHQMSLLVACGNSICGNSAIAATAPVIGANGKDVAASIAFTAVLGVIVVLALPLLIPVLGLTPAQYGVMAGLTVYAVPQVLAATIPVASLSVQIGTLVKLVRVLMLGPVVFVLAMSNRSTLSGRNRIGQFVPWFIVGFLGLMALRSLDLIPASLLAPMGSTATILTIVSMAALGLGVDARVVARAGGRVTAAVVLSLLALGTVSILLIRVIGIA